MIKKHIKLLISTSIMIILPAIVGLFLWDSLPSQLPVHWNINGEIDQYTSKAVAVFLFPSLFLIIHLLSAFKVSADKKLKSSDGKPFTLLLCCTPAASIVCTSIIYMYALGMDINVDMIFPVVMGVLFIVLGNFLPKCSQNSTIGIKLPWTLNNEENWDKTHKLAGYVWIAGGFIMTIFSFTGSFIVPMIVSAIMIIIPTVYSYIIDKKMKNNIEK